MTSIPRNCPRPRRWPAGAATSTPTRCATCRSTTEFNQHFRQLLHIAFKLAAKEGVRYTDLLKANAEVVGKNVTENLYDRHFKRLFVA